MLFLYMFIRKKKNKSGSISVQIVSKQSGKFKVIKRIGTASCNEEIQILCKQAETEINKIKSQLNLFPNEKDIFLENFIETISNSQIEVIGPELVFGKIFDYIGYGVIGEKLFRHLVITRLVYPGSKLRTIEYLKRYQNIEISKDRIYRFLDTLQNEYKEQVEDISFSRTKQLLGGEVKVIFYDLTTLYFESSKEDELKITGYSKDGKFDCPQIFLGLLVGIEGYAIGYDIFKGNINEGNTLIPIIEKFEKRFNLKKPVIIADSGILSKKNIEILENTGYEYVIGARIKNEKKDIKEKIIKNDFKIAKTIRIKKSDKITLIVSYSRNRAVKDNKNRKRGLERLEKSIKSGKLTKENINNRGYNKYLKLEGKTKVTIDKEKFESDEKWEGLKGYITNTKLRTKAIIENYRQLWEIERAFRISKTDLVIRPIFHRIHNRIESHICIAYVAYSIYKDLERALKKSRIEFSVMKAAEMTKNMYQVRIVLPESQKESVILLKMDENQKKLMKVVKDIF